jgi:hypothetical protein
MPNLFGGSAMIWRGYDSSNFSHRGLYVDGDMWVTDEQTDTNIPSFGNPQNWYWLAVTKTAASAVTRAHWAVYDGTNPMAWSHVDALASQPSANAINRVCLGDEFSTQFRGNLACLSLFTTAMTDAAVESLFLRDSASILAATPKFFAHWPQAAGIGSTFHDLAGGGVETIRSGNWDVSADPPNFSFSLGRSGKPKVWDGSAWGQHQGKTWNGSTWVPHAIDGATVGGWITSK